MIKELIIILLLTLLGVAAMVVALYLYIEIGGFSWTFSRDNQDWGAFGSYWGGVLTPIFGLTSVVILWRTLLHQQSEIRRQFSLELKQDMLRLVEKQENRIDSLLHEEIESQGAYSINLYEIIEGVHGVTDRDSHVYKRAVYRLFKLCGEYVESLMLYRDNVSPYFVYRFHRRRIEEYCAFFDQNSDLLSEWDRTASLGMLKELVGKL